MSACCENRQEGHAQRYSTNIRIIRHMGKQNSALVCGAGGFIGSHLAEELVRLGRKVVVVDDLTNGRMGNLASAVERLSESIAIKKVSSVYETEPVYYEEQPLFLNAALSGLTELDPFDLLRFVKGIETELGRQPSFRNAPRLIDIDILFYGDRIIDTLELTIPHPRIAERAFVLVPLAEIAPEMVHPLIHKKVKDLLSVVDEPGGLKKIGRLSLKRKVS
mgnify:CR=1 FL=1